MAASSPLLDSIVARFDHPKPTGTGTMVQCPAHNDRKQSLNISVGDDGKVLVKCHAGCETADILEKVGLGLKDLFPEKPRTNGRQPTAPTVYPYTDEDGALLYQVLRTPTEDGKKFSQRKPKPGGGWDYRLNGVPRVLYRLPEVLRAIAVGEPILYPEGEKDVHRLETLGYTATTNAGGVKGWRPEFTPMLARADLLLFPDHDPPGYARVLEVYRAVAAVVNSVEVVRVVGLPEKSDISDYLDRYGDWAEADLARIVGGKVTSTVDEDGVGMMVITVDELGDLAAKSTATTDPAVSPDPGVSSLVSFFAPEFPIDVFPDEVRRYVEEGAEAINVPVDMIALPLLAVAGGTIGNTVALAVKPSWIERANPWLAEVAPPGSGKSPAMDYALAPVRAIQHRAVEAYRVALDAWQEQVDAAKGEKGNHDPLPDKPVLDHYFTTDVTVEGLVNVLKDNPGVTVMRDELGGLVASFDAYRKGADRQSYLSLWAGSSLKVDRKGAGTTWVPRPCVAVIGGIQPDMLADLGEKDGKRDGFIERFLVAQPKPRPQRWTDADVDPQLRLAMITLFGKLRVKHRAKTEAELAADVEQGVLFMTAQAKEAFASWYDQNAAITEESQGIAAGFYAKYPGQLARIALILHCLHHPGDATTSVGVDSITGAINVIEYFRGHLVAILPRFGGKGSTATAGLDQRVMAVLDKHCGEWISRTDLHGALHNNTSAPELAELLERLTDEGKVENRRVQPSGGGRPREETRSRSAKKLTNEETPPSLAPQFIPFGDAP